MLIMGQLDAVFHQAALAWAGAAAVSIPIALHLLTRIRRRTQPWGAMRFLVESFKKHRHRLRLEQWLLLLVRCLIVLFLGLAMSGPMLSGCASWAGRGGAGGAGGVGGVGGGRSRVLHLLIDDSIASRAVLGDGSRTIDRIKRIALAMVDALDPGDRVAIWRTGRPVGHAADPVDVDPVDARRLIESIEVGFAGSDIPAVLGDVHQSLRDGRYDRAENYLVLLSAFTRGVVNLDEPLPAGLAGLGRRSGLLALPPADLGANVQIAGIQPARHVVFTGAGSVLPSLSVAVELRRFGNDPGVASTEVQVTASGANGEELFVDHHTHRWAAGRVDGFVQIDVPLRKLTDAAGWGAGGHAAAIGLSARITHPTSPQQEDVNEADNQRWALVQARQGMRVALVSEGQPRGAQASRRMSPARWVRLALTPYDAVGREEAVELTALDPGALNGPALSGLDAAIVLDPQRVATDGWRALRRFSEDGGITWVIVPPSDRAPLWAGAMHESFGVDWRLGFEATGPDAGQRGSWRVGPSRRAPALFGELSSDWQALLRPVRVNRHLVLDPHGAGHDVLLETDRGSPLLVVTGVGRGSLAVLATALDLDWTNLPAKPLFVPLVHELLVSLIGRATPEGLGGPLVCGQQMSSDPSTSEEQRFVRWSVSGPGEAGDKPAVPTPGPIRDPGFYRVATSGIAQHVAVNPDADGADTGPIAAARLVEWLGAAGQWAWLNEQDPAAVLAQEQTRADLSSPLMWLTAVLVLLETCLARWFTHAVMPARSGSAQRGQPRSGKVVNIQGQMA